MVTPATPVNTEIYLSARWKLNSNVTSSAHTLHLDCENGESTINCLASVFCCQPEALTSFIKTIDLEAIYEAHWEELDVPPHEFLFRRIVERFGQPRTPTAVSWFHLTRTLPNNAFLQGIQPLGQILENIWEMMIARAPEPIIKERLLNLKQSGACNRLYQLKVADIIHWGPYGYLVRDVAFHAERLYQHDYLDIPEIVEDICIGYETAWGGSILDIYKQNLIPCIVKFNGECD